MGIMRNGIASLLALACGCAVAAEQVASDIGFSVDAPEGWVRSDDARVSLALLAPGRDVACLLAAQPMPEDATGSERSRVDALLRGMVARMNGRPEPRPRIVLSQTRSLAGHPAAFLRLESPKQRGSAWHTQLVEVSEILLPGRVVALTCMAEGPTPELARERFESHRAKVEHIVDSARLDAAGAAQ